MNADTVLRHAAERRACAVIPRTLGSGYDYLDAGALPIGKELRASRNIRDRCHEAHISWLRNKTDRGF